LTLAWPAVAEEIHRTLDVNEKPEIRIFNNAGDIVVSGWSR
jgi:hypothetical protein